MQTECGYTPSQVAEMTLHEVDRIFRYWRRNPPAGQVIVAIAKTLGVEFREGDRRPAMSPEDFVRWIDATGGTADGIAGSING